MPKGNVEVRRREREKGIGEMIIKDTLRCKMKLRKEKNMK